MLVRPLCSCDYDNVLYMYNWRAGASQPSRTTGTIFPKLREAINSASHLAKSLQCNYSARYAYAHAQTYASRARVECWTQLKVAGY